ncbi:hypothetical protein [Hoeflea prorocentri]|uniref:Uncharacterized protein n=1 Tax=Hoeflea prorocentri TaxID=1922333 RepID=A0A9X3ZI13_9HYPH|nr:hypothetical protein [Hoeflea prorocentri]MCY6381944.1 hypothetical protein [Hoeflea prorocentri]MDA5399744.1 hypothetical protein [Hoeflea prorocentri]
MWKVLFFLLICIASMPLAVLAQDANIDVKINALEAQIRAIESDIDTVNDGQDAEMAKLNGSIDELRRRIQRFNEDYERLQSALATTEALRGQITTLTTDVATAKKEANQSSEAANSVRWIVSIAAILITGMTAVLGLLFSQRFVDLKADARVAQEVLARVEKRMDESTDTNQVLARIERYTETIVSSLEEKPG